MTIGIDANWLIYENAGIGKYSYNLILEILKNDHQNRYILMANFIRHFRKRKQILNELVKKSGNKNVSIKISCLPSAWREWLSNTKFPQKLLTRQQIDLYFSTYISGIARNGFFNQVVVIYDLVFVHFPEHAGKKLSDYYLMRTKNALDNCQQVIAISQSTKKDLVKYFNIDQSRVTIAYPGVDHNLFHQDLKGKQNLSQKYRINKPYILSVGTLEPRKNLETLIEAFEKLPEIIQQKHQLVLVGKNGWNNQNLKFKIKNLKLNKKIVETGYVPDYDLPFLYSNAEVFVYPSLYEGFGMPPLEAMACGCPVIVSNNSSFPEVVGNAGIKVKAKDISQIAKEIERVLKNNKLKKELILKGIDQAKKFNWSTSAKNVIKVFEKIGLDK